MAFPLFNHGILGLNARNLLFIKPFNRKKAIAFADDKLKTKMFLGSRGIPVAKVYARIDNRRQLKEFDFKSLPDTCVLKPNAGFGGEGIIILKGKHKGEFLENGKTPITEELLREHIEDILDGKYSLSGHHDTAFFEQILTADPCFSPFRPAGLPDIRVIVFNLVPVMAMLRIPTAESRGKANVHLGGIGIGIDMARGVTTTATQYNRVIQTLPQGGPIAGFQIPHWEEILLISSRIQQIVNLGYLAADITIDADLGPTLLEVNARAGLMVQIANLAPLRSRLERVQGLKVGSPEKGVRMAQELFGAATRTQADEPENVLGTREIVSLGTEGGAVDIPARIDLTRERTALTQDLFDELVSIGLELPQQDDDLYHLKFSLGEKKIQTIAEITTLPGPERLVIGQRDLAGFLIDPKKTAFESHETRVRTDMHVIDRQLARADHALSLLRMLRPVNLVEERIRAEEDLQYAPLFQFSALPAEIEDIEERLQTEVRDESPLGRLLEAKRRELLDRITLLKARGDAAAFTDASARLFPKPDAAIVARAETALSAHTTEDDEKTIGPEEAVEQFRAAVDRYGLHEWQVVIRESMVADCTVGGNVIAVRGGARFSKAHIAALIAHEIETHAITGLNGTQQPWLLLRRGTAGYMETQEGLAIWNQNRVLPAGHGKRLGPARSLLAVQYALAHGFVDTRKYLETHLGYDPAKALSKTIDVKRGIKDTSEPGAFTKGAVYLRGAESIARFIADGGDLKRLYIGKVTLQDLPLIEQIPDLQNPLVLPEWLRGQ